MGALWFLIVQRAHDHFYGQFGVNTTEVGADLAVVAYRAAYSLLLFGGFALIGIWSFISAIENFWRIATGRAGSQETPWPRFKQWLTSRRLTAWLTQWFGFPWFGMPRRLVLALVGLFLFVTVYALLVTIPSRRLGDRIRRGESVLTVTEVWPLLWVHAERVSPQWIDVPEPRRLPGGHDFMYLGSKDGTVVLYDVCTQSALRVPAERVMLSPVENEDPVDPDTC